jgi:FtsH-binding integral membrane protein
MAEYQTIRTAGVGTRAAQIDAGLRAHMNKVYGLMSVGMLLTGAVAWAVAGLSMSSVPVEGGAQIGTDLYLTAFGAALFATPLKWVVMFAPLVLVFAFSAAINRLSVAGAQLFFYFYAAVMGLSLASIFLVFTGESIAQTFLITAIAFAGLSLYGYTTKRDLSGFGTFLIMGVIGLVVASIVNIFLASSALAFAVSVLGVLIFAGLTAYDTQNIKNTYIQHAQAADSEWLGKAAIMGALQLYLDFINLFMFLLQFLGNNRQ